MGTTVDHYEIPSECIGGVVVNEGSDFHVEVRKLPVPEIGQHDVLIKMNVTGLCHSDIHYMACDAGLPKMSAFGVQCCGHEGAGVIVKVGDQVKTLKIGQRAGLKPAWDVCHSCESCRAGRDNYCLKAISTGMQVDGSYKQYVVSPERYTILIPDDVDDYVAAPIMCSASTMLHSLKTANLKPGQWAVFPGGGGGVGIQGVQLAAAVGLRPIVVDTGSERRQMTKAYGAEHFVDFKEVDDPVAEVLKLTDGGAHAVFVTAVQAYPIAMGYLGSREAAKLMSIGIPEPARPGIDLSFQTFQTLLFRNQSISGTIVSPIGDIAEALEFARRGKLHLNPTVVGLSEWNDAVQRLKNGQVAGRIVVDFNKP